MVTEQAPEQVQPSTGPAFERADFTPKRTFTRSQKRRVDDLNRIILLALIPLLALLGSLMFWRIFHSDVSQTQPEEIHSLQYRVDLNNATHAELALLPGIGSSLADRIIEARTREPFTDIQQLNDRVRGIGARKLSVLLPYIYVTEMGVKRDAVKEVEARLVDQKTPVIESAPEISVE